MPDQTEEKGESINRRNLLRKTGAVGGTFAAIGAASQPASADKQSNGPDLTAVHDGFGAADDAMFEDLRERGFIDEPTVDALGVRRTARGPQDDESVGNTIIYTIQGETHTAIETKVSTESESAHVTVFPETGQSVVSIGGEEGQSERTNYGTGIRLNEISSTSNCEEMYGCSCTEDQCDCANFVRTNWSHCCCSCGDDCNRCWYECNDCEEGFLSC